MGSCFFILFAVLFGWIFLDVAIYNFLMIIINVIYCIPLLKTYIDVNLDTIETRVYENVFKKNIDKRTFKRILEKAKLSFIPEGGKLVQQGQMYDGVYLIAKLKKTHHLVFKENDSEIFREAKPYTWMGLIEYDQMRKCQLQKKEYKWPISIGLEKKETNDEDTDPLNKRYDEPLYIYYFKFTEIQKLYDEENGIYVRNALHSVWLEAMTQKIIEIDLKVSKIQKKENEIVPNQINQQEQKEKGFFEKVKDVVCGDEEKNDSQINIDNYDTDHKLIKETEHSKKDRVKYNANVSNKNKDEKPIDKITKPEINQIDHNADNVTKLKVDDLTEDVAEKQNKSINHVLNDDNKDNLDNDDNKYNLDNDENKDKKGSYYTYEDNLSDLSGFQIKNHNQVDDHA